MPRRLTALAGQDAPPPSSAIPSGLATARDLTFLAAPQETVEGPSSLLLTRVHSRYFASRVLKPVGRDPERPKRPLSPYFAFLAKFRAQNPGLRSRAPTLASEQWKVMSGQEKRPFEEAYAAEKKVFDKSFKEYVDSGKKAAWERPPGKPKQPLTAYLLFSQEYRKKNPSMKMVDATRSSSSIWKGMTVEQRLPYEQHYKKAKEEYTERLKAYKESGEEQAWRDKVGITAKENKAKAVLEKKKAAAKKKAVRLAEKKKAQSEKKKALAQKKKAAAAETKKKMMERKKEAAAKKKAAMMEKKKAAAEKKKAAEEKKKNLMRERKKAAAEKDKQKKKKLAEQKKAAEAKKKLLEKKKRAAEEKKRKLVEEKKKAAEEKKQKHMKEKKEAAEEKKKERAQSQEKEAAAATKAGAGAKKLPNATTEAEKLKNAGPATAAPGKS